jgi:hypothetical protein
MPNPLSKPYPEFPLTPNKQGYWGKLSMVNSLDLGRDGPNQKRRCRRGRSANRT